MTLFALELEDSAGAMSEEPLVFRDDLRVALDRTERDLLSDLDPDALLLMAPFIPPVEHARFQRILSHARHRHKLIQALLATEHEV